MAGIPKEHQDAIAYHLNMIGVLFKNPRITLVIRNPDLTAKGLDGDVVISHTDEDLEEVIRAIKVRQFEQQQKAMAEVATQAVS